MGMDIEVKEISNSEIRIFVKGETYTLLTPIVEELNSREDVEFAGYDVPHPLKEEGIIFLRVKDGLDPKKILREAVKRLIEEYDGLERSFRKEMERLATE